MKTLNGITFLETKDIKKALQIGNKTCLDLFNKKDFPGKKIGKSWLVMEKLLRIILNFSKIQIYKKQEDLNMRHLNLQKF